MGSDGSYPRTNGSHTRDPPSSNGGSTAYTDTMPLTAGREECVPSYGSTNSPAPSDGAPGNERWAASDLEAGHKETQRLLGPAKEPRLSEACVWAYSVGHVMNDATAACWFSYLLILLENVRGLSPLSAGLVMFSGQVWDGIATPIVGILSDCTPGIPWLNWSGRKVWYLIGMVLGGLAFLGTFASDPLPHGGELGDGGWVRVAYFATCASLFNIGWAAVQVCHLATVPELCNHDSERMRLVKLRYAFTILSNLSVFLLYLYGASSSSPSPSSATTTTTSATSGMGRGRRFRFMSMVVLGVGSLCALFFLKYAHAPPRRRRPPPSKDAAQERPPHPSSSSRLHPPPHSAGTTSTTHSDDGSSSCTPHPTPPPSPPRGPQRPRAVSSLSDAPSLSLSGPSSWTAWLGVRDFYLCAVVYMASRVVVNITQVYCQFFVLEVLGLGDVALALVPLTMYVSSLGATLLAVDPLNHTFGRKHTLLAGSGIVLLSCVGFYFLQPSGPSSLFLGCRHPLLYLTCGVAGVGSTIVMVTSHSMANDLVQHPSHAHLGRRGGGFLYGAFSLTDKLANGILILAIQSLKESTCTASSPLACAHLLRGVMSLVPALTALLACYAAHFVTTSDTLPRPRRDSLSEYPASPVRCLSPPKGGSGRVLHGGNGNGNGQLNGCGNGYADGPVTREVARSSYYHYSSYVEPVDQQVLWSDWVI